ncbi:MAG: RsmF rRNA methyltransferase first C-terminal domain-containing protein [Christensenellales bacterium]
MFRRQPEARGEWDADSPHRCADRQMEILEQAAKMLRPGGTMVYSTCTFNDIENEGVLKRFLALHPEFTLQPFALPGLPEAKDGYLHLYPHEMRGEGHFVSRLNKSADTSETESPVQAAPKKKTSARPAASAKGKAPAPIVLPDVFSDAFTPNRLYAAGDALWMLPEQISIERLHGLRVLRTGLLLAHAEGKRSEPDHALAMALRPKEAARTANLTIEQALAYQAGETLALGDLPGGYTLLCCEGVSLGWGKQAGGMMKNHYPKGLRRRN